MIMKKLFRGIAAALLLCTAAVQAVSLTSCTGDTEKISDIVIESVTASEGEITEAPKNAAVLMSSLAEIWKEAGGEVSITVGESVERGFADDSAILVDSGAGKTVNTELLISLKPDIVICSEDIPAQVEAAELLKDAGIRTEIYRVESFSDYLSVLDSMTDITGNKNAYTEKGLRVKEQIEALLGSDAAKSAAGKNILFVRAGSSASSTKAKLPDDHFACAMLEELGCVNIADGESPLIDSLSMEYIISTDPCYIFFSMMGNEDAAMKNINSMLEEETWKSLTAVKENRVVILPKDLFHFKPNAKWADAYKYLIDIFAEN